MESVIFVPCTPRSALQRELQKAEDTFCSQHGTDRVRFVERGGDKLTTILGRKCPFRRIRCERKDCWTCNTSVERQWGRCHKEGIVYSIICQGCKDGGKKAQYYGETARTSFIRGKEHQNQLEGEVQESPLWEHCVLHHSGNKQVFKMEVVATYSTAFRRQIGESIRISSGDADIIINCKGEWNGDRIPRLAVEQGESIKIDTKIPGVLPPTWTPASRKRPAEETSNPAKRSKLEEKEESTVNNANPVVRVEAEIVQPATMVSSINKVTTDVNVEGLTDPQDEEKQEEVSIINKVTTDANVEGLTDPQDEEKQEVNSDDGGDLSVGFNCPAPLISSLGAWKEEERMDVTEVVAKLAATQEDMYIETGKPNVGSRGLKRKRRPVRDVPRTRVICGDWPIPSEPKTTPTSTPMEEEEDPVTEEAMELDAKPAIPSAEQAGLIHSMLELGKRSGRDTYIFKTKRKYTRRKIDVEKGQQTISFLKSTKTNINESSGGLLQGNAVNQNKITQKLTKVNISQEVKVKVPITPTTSAMPKKPTS